MWARYACLILLASLSHAADTITPGKTLRENETLTSAAGVFELGFFQDAVSGNVFLGIWFKNIGCKKPVWVANRDNPLEHLYATFQIRGDGNMIVADRKTTQVIINSGALATSHNTSAALLDSGNLILREGGEIIWQSFDFPSDTLLPGMRLGRFGLQTAQPSPPRSYLVSWLSPTNPTRGAYTVGLSYDSRTIGIWRGDTNHMDFASRGKDGFTFMFNESFDSFNLTYTSTVNDSYLAYNTVGKYDMSWLVVASTGQLDEYALYRGRVTLKRHDLCNDSSAVNTSVCLKDVSTNCQGGDKFVAVNGSMPSSISLNISIIDDFDDCELTCRTNCSCVAFAFAKSGCQLYYGSKKSLSNLSGSSVFHIRTDSTSRKKGGKKKKMAIIILTSSIATIILAAIAVLWCFKRRHKLIFAANQVRDAQDSGSKGEAKLIAIDAKAATTIDIWTNDIEFTGEDHNLTWFCMNTLENATCNFDAKNKLGEGGFGPVYKGKLVSGEEIAVKRLSRRSDQGVKEFRTEATLISRLQHRNLVQLLGCCIHGEEYILVYEYLINRSLDSFIFDESKQMLVNWNTRMQIIEGIAQGILYLHKYSRVKIIHRDLKSSNILLDGNMNPKISDFGMARIYGENQTRAQTTKIAGTYGYMSPEYAMDGHFSEKSDVFSFGIILLEIISGKRNISFFESDHALNLLGYAWKLWKEGRSIEFVDSTVASSCTAGEAAKYVQLGLLCVQERAADRPVMLDFVAMVSSHIDYLPLPKEPAFLT